MRWAVLFHDLESQMEAQVAEEQRWAALDIAEAEMAAVTLEDRLRGALGGQVTLHTLASAVISGVLEQVGAGFVVVEAARAQWVVPTARLAGVRMDSRAREGSGVLARLGVGHALREIARDGQPVRVAVVGSDVSVGHLVRVGKDHVDLAAPGGVWTIPWGAIDYVATT